MTCTNPACTIERSHEHRVMEDPDQPGYWMETFFDDIWPLPRYTIDDRPRYAGDELATVHADHPHPSIAPMGRRMTIVWPKWRAELLAQDIAVVWDTTFEVAYDYVMTLVTVIPNELEMSR